jgi:Rad3-related DNA helicase
MLSSIRIKVQVGEDKTSPIPNQKTNVFRKFVYVIDSPSNQTIDDLIRNLQEYISQKFSFTKTQIVDLKTADGYLLSKSDKCSNVLKDDDHILCVDMQKFIEEYSSKFKDAITWLEIRQHDASNNREKFIRIGLNNFSELFVRMHGIVGVSALHVFGIHELMKIAKEKRKGKKEMCLIKNEFFVAF